VLTIFWALSNDPDTCTPSLSHMLLLTHLSIVLGFKLPRPLEQTSAADEKVRSTAQEDAEDAKKSFANDASTGYVDE